MLRLLLAAAALCAAAHGASAAAAAAAAERVDVCVVGAGPAGVAAAVTLARRNKSVALLERRRGVGGQAYASYTDPSSGVRLHMGAVIVISPEDTTVLGFAKELGIGIQRLDMPYVGFVAGKATIPTARLLSALPDAVPSLRSALDNYTAARAALLPALLAEGGMAAMLRAAPQLNANFDAWMRDNGATPLIPIVAHILLATGYGHLYEASAAALLQVLPPSFLTSFIVGLGVPPARIVPPAERDNPWFNAAYTVFEDDIGFAEFLRRMAALLPAGALRLGVNITAVVRPAVDDSTSEVELTYADASSPRRLLRCGALANTAAPTARGAAYLNPDAAEAVLFAAVRANRYFTTALRIQPGLRTGVYGALPPADAALFLAPPAAPSPADAAAQSAGAANGTASGGGGALQPRGRPALPLLASLVDRFPYRGDVTFLSTATAGAANRPAGVAASPAPTLAVAYSLADVATTRGAVAANATRAVSGSSRSASAEAVFSWAMFPRVSQADAAAGWYDTAAQMQGRRRLYHAGGTFTAWTVDKAMRSGVELAQRYF